ncbi:MAG TPA: acyl-protein synthetase [Byssovorax sp.]
MSDDLHARVLAFVDASMRGETAESFDALALDVARRQRRCVAPFARLVAARGADLDASTSAAAIPALPTDVFRFARVAAHPPELDARVFLTSGTSLGAEARGEHAMRTTSTYEAVARAWADRMLLARTSAGLASVSLVPSASAAPASSLSFMVDAFARALDAPRTWHLEGDRIATRDGGVAAIDVDSVARACAELRTIGRPAIVFGASFSFVHLLDAAPPGSLALPSGSRAMQTGGFKGRAREVDGEELRASIAAAFALPIDRVIGEYGMTELSSQLYEGLLEGGAPGVYRAPPWLRVEAVDPVTLAELPRGEVGLARFVDLGNVDSCVAIQTADRVRVRGDGGVELLGRAPGAAPRGCSIAIDMALERGRA